MNHARVGGQVCLFVVMMAAVLLMGGSAQDDASVEGAPPSDAVTEESAEETSPETITDTTEGTNETTIVESAEEISPETITDTTEGTNETTTVESAEETSPETITDTTEGTNETTTVESAEEISPETITDTTEDTNETTTVESAEETSPETITDTTEDTNETTTVESAEETSPETITEEDVSENEEKRDLISTGDRIWRAGYCTLDYTWTPQSFSGFFYDIDDNVGTENLTVHLKEDDRSIEEDDLVYETTAQNMNFEFNDWGSYQVIGFMAEKYFAGYYDGTNRDVVDDEINLIDEGELRKVLIDSDEEYTVTTGSVLPLEEGYELRIKEIDLDGNKVWFALADEDGDEIDSNVVVPGDIGDSTYTYTVDISGDDMPQVMVHVSNVFAGAETSLVTIDGIFQISDDYTTIEDGDQYGKMEVDEVSGNTIRMKNDNSISLRKGKTVPFMGDVSFQVADNNTLKFAPFVKKIGNYEIRGTVVDPSEVKKFTWTPYNFEGFYYDIDDDVGTEKLIAKFSGFQIDDDDLTYETKPQGVEFEYSNWGNYDVIGFMAEKYFAGYNDKSEFTDEFSVLNEEELRKVLLDDDESYTLRSGATFPLEEGYELRIKEVDLDGNKVWLSLTKDGDEVDNKVIDPGRAVKSSTYRYEVEIGSEDVPIIAAHIESIFRGREEDLATIDGIFQISDSSTDVEEGEMYGKMEIDSISNDGITMKSDSSISLGRGKTVSFMGNMKFKTADNATKRLVAPIVEIKGEIKPMNLAIQEAIVGSPAEIKVTSKGKPVSGARIMIEGDEIGSTDGDGVAIYLPAIAGTFDVEAKKLGYDDATSTITIKEIKEERIVAISAPPEVLKGEDFVIKVTIGLDPRPVDGAEIFFDDAKIGTTDSHGIFSYASDSVGIHAIKAAKKGYEENSRKIVVLTPVETLGLEMKEQGTTGKKIKVIADLENKGTVSDNRTLELKVNGATVDTKYVTVGAGESETVTFEYIPETPGTYTMEIDDLQKTVTVEDSKISGAMIAVILILLIIIGGGAYLYTTGKLDSQMESIKGSLKK
ncbi:MAG: S-layer protein domain-containing protein [Methanotrichaceae archaeon]